MTYIPPDTFFILCTTTFIPHTSSNWNTRVSIGDKICFKGKSLIFSLDNFEKLNKKENIIEFRNGHTVYLTQYEVILKEHDPDHPENVEFSVGSEEGEIKRDQPEWHQLHLATEQIRYGH